MHQIRVIIADHEPDSHRALVRHLRENNFEVDIADDAEQTMELLRKGNGAYDVIVLDDQMNLSPTRLDVPITNQIRAFFPDVQIIVLSRSGLDIGPEAFQ